jgi:hypothetical protein
LTFLTLHPIGFYDPLAEAKPIRPPAIEAKAMRVDPELEAPPQLVTLESRPRRGFSHRSAERTSPVGSFRPMGRRTLLLVFGLTARAPSGLGLSPPYG